MARTTILFRLHDFTATSIATTSEVYFHPVQMSTRGPGWSNVFVDKPVRADYATSGLYTIELEDRHYYRMEVLWQDPDRSRVGRSEWHGPFMVPSASDDINLSRVIGLPAKNGMIRVLQAAPGSGIFDQYVYNETTGDLYERTA